jgi:DNA-binding FadR family transcriptional regulator
MKSICQKPGFAKTETVPHAALLDEDRAGQGREELMKRIRQVQRIPAQIAGDLGAKIVSGRLKAGTFLDGEVEASGQRQVSRSAYREAVRILRAKGLVESRTKIGTMVSAIEKWHLLDPDVLAWMCLRDPSPQLLISLFELRITVEPEAAAFAAQRRSQAQLYAMADALTEMERETLQTEKGRAADRVFHSTLLAASQNPFLATLSSSVAAAVDLSTFFKQRTQRLTRDAVPDHWRVYRAIAAADPAAARKAMRHLVKSAFEDTTAAALNGASVNLGAP